MGANLAFYVTTAVLDAVYLYFLLTFLLEQKNGKSKGLFALCFIAFAGIIVLLNYAMPQQPYLRFFIVLAAIFLLVKFLYGITFMAAAIVSSLFVTMMLVCDVFTNGMQSLMHILFPQWGTERIFQLSAVAYYAYFLLSLLVFRGFPRNTMQEVRGVQGLVLLCVPLASAMMIFYSLNWNSAIASLPWYVYFILSAYYLIMTAFVTIFYRHIAHGNEIAMERAVLGSQMKLFQSHIALLNESDNALREFKHDFRHHMTVLRGFSLDKKYDALDKYLENIAEFPDSIINKISGNLVLDSIFQALGSQAKNKGIIMDIHTQLPQSMGIDDGDLCVLVSNLLANAIEACEKVQDKEKRISVNMLIDGAYLSLLVRNSIQENAIDVKKELTTTKPDKQEHGIGLRNVRTIIRKYHGEILFDSCDHTFAIKCLLKVINT